MKVETIEIKKQDKVELWKVFKFEDGKTFRFTNKMFVEYTIWKEKYLDHFQYRCLFVSQKNLFIDKDKRDRVIIIPTISDNFKINSKYKLLARDNTHTMILLDHNNDILIEYPIDENKKRYVWFGSQESNNKQIVQIVEVENDVNLDIETIKKVYEKKNNKIKFGFLRYSSVSTIDDSIKIHKDENHEILIAENAQLVRALDCYTLWKNVLIPGGKRYLEVNMHGSSGTKYTYHSDTIPLITDNDKEIIKAIKDEKIVYALAEIPNNIDIKDIEITIKKWSYDAKSYHHENTYYDEPYQSEVSDYTEYSNIKLIKEEKVKLSDLLNLT
ncbi:MAG: hypothetical protein JHC31_12425 [Sulfurihydrogenibium sp.]|jgi:hypothetical protein|nr:hypothetical protein [Sulfurihydrogenibium sp.]